MRSVFALTALALLGCNAELDNAPELQLEDLQTIGLPGNLLAEGLTLNVPNEVQIGSNVPVAITGATPNSTIRLAVATDLGFGVCPAALSNSCVGLENITTLRTATADANGDAVLNFAPGAALLGEERFVVAIEQNGAASVRSNFKRVRITDGSARIRVVHASPDAPAVDIYADGSLLVPNLGYLESSGFATVPANTYQIDIRAAGADPSSPAVFTIPALELGEDATVTAVASGFLGSTAADDAFRVVPLADGWADPTPGGFQVRALHASPDAPTVDVDVFSDGAIDIPTFERFADTGADGIGLPAETPFAISVAGGAIPFSLPALPQGAQVTLAAVGELGAARNNAENAFGLLAIIDDGAPVLVRQDPLIYAFHASTNASTVDIQIAGDTVIDDFNFGDLAGPLQVPPGEYLLDIFDGTGSTYVTSWGTPALEAGETYFLNAAGLVGGSPAFNIFPVVDDIALGSTDAQLRVLHASPDAGPVTAGAIIGDYVPLSNTLDFGDTAADIAVGAGDYNLAVGDATGTNAILFFPELSLFEGDRLFGIAYGEVGAGTFGLQVIDTTTSPWSSAFVPPVP